MYRRKLQAILAVSILLLLGFFANETVAFLIDTDGPVKNELIPGQITTEIEETFVGMTKSNVSIKNTGNIEAYIRAAVIVTWKDAEGYIYSKMPVAGEDYHIIYHLDSGWLKGSDGFFYWTKPVKSESEDPADCSTGILIGSCTPVEEKVPPGYYLNVEIIGSGIQSVPAAVVVDQWENGISGVEGTTLTIKGQGGA